MKLNPIHTCFLKYFMSINNEIFYFYSIPGHVDPGETDMQTAFRETEEEAGFVRDDLKIFEEAKQEMEYLVNGKPKVVIYWLAELINTKNDARLSGEHQDFKWLPLKEACALAGYSEMQTALKASEKYISENVLSST